MRLSEQEKNRLKQKYGDWSIVTAASSGIGLELAERLAEAGLNLVISARNVNKLKDVENA
jgi:short-subunit dehydrogenase